MSADLRRFVTYRRFNTDSGTVDMTRARTGLLASTIITGILLAIWFIATFVMGYYARDLNFDFFGWPFSFYMAAQGSLIIYVLIIWFYARYMNKLDIEYDVHEGEE
jgi:putative solute:sodium symporter small subunit